MEISVITLPRVCSTQPCPHPSTWCNSPFTPALKGAAEEVEVAAEVAAVEATRPTLSSSNLLNDTQTNVLASSHPGQKGIIFSETLLDNFHPHTPPEGEKTLSVQSLQERAKTPCVQSLQERAKTPCVQSLQEREKTPCTKSRHTSGRQTQAFSYPVGTSRGPLVYTQSTQGRLQTAFQRTPKPVQGALHHQRLRRLRQSALLTSIQDLLHKGAVEVVHTQNSLGFDSRLFQVPKPGYTSGRQTQAFSYPVGTSRGPLVYTQSTQGRLQTAFQRTPKPVQGALHHQRLRRLRQSSLLTSIQDLLHKGAVEVVHTQNSLGFYSRLFLVPKPGNRWRPVIDLSSLHKFPVIPKFKMETPESIRAFLRKGEWVTSIDLMDAYLHVPIHTHFQKYLRFHHKGVTYQFVSLPFGLATAPLVFYQSCQGGKTTGTTTRNQTIPRRLVNPCPLQGGVPLTNTSTTQSGEGLRLCSKPQEVRTLSLPAVRLPRIPFFTGLGSCEAHARQMDKTSGNVSSPLKEVCYQCKDSYVHHWIACINREDCKIGQDAYETFSVASQESLEISDASRHTSPLESENDTTPGMVVRPTKCATRRISPSQGTRKTNIYRRLKCRLGRSLRSRLYRRSLVSSRKASTHQPIRNEGSFSGTTILQKDLSKQSSPHHLRQHLSGGIHQQTGRHSIGRTLCPNVENPNMVQSEQCDTQSTTHPGITQHNSGQPLQEEPDPINRMVPLSTNLQTNFQTLGESPSGPIRNQPEHKTPSLRLSNSRPSGMGCGCPEHSMGKPGCVRFPSHRPAAQGCTKTPIPDLQDNSHRPRLADKIMVLGSSGDVSGHTKTTTTHSHSAQTATEQPIPCKPSSLNLHVWYLGVQSSKNAGSLQRWQKELLLLKDSQREPSTPQNGQFFKNGAQRNRWTSGIHL